jgi:hypothetical protein
MSYISVTRTRIITAWNLFVQTLNAKIYQNPCSSAGDETCRLIRSSKSSCKERITKPNFYWWHFLHTRLGRQSLDGPRPLASVTVSSCLQGLTSASIPHSKSRRMPTSGTHLSHTDTSSIHCSEDDESNQVNKNGRCTPVSSYTVLSKRVLCDWQILILR